MTTMMTKQRESVDALISGVVDGTSAGVVLVGVVRAGVVLVDVVLVLVVLVGIVLVSVVLVVGDASLGTHVQQKFVSVS